MRVSKVGSVMQARPLFKGSYAQKNDVENNFKKMKTLMGQPIKRPLFK